MKGVFDEFQEHHSGDRESKRPILHEDCLSTWKVLC